ncbi:MAG: patatin-like phospholipase family protein [Candidatus Omnitrophica bacterium]|nr:patatin-like phospholipase family protein [Candidatus Omnitrophota bacterium]
MNLLSNLLNQLQIVRQIPVFAKLNWFDQQRIARKCVFREYSKGSFIRKEGDPADFFYCVVSGRIQAFTLNAHDDKENVEFIHRGSHFGILSVFTGETHSNNYEALNDSVILQIAKNDFHAILKLVPELSIQFSKILSNEMRRKIKGHKGGFLSTIISVYSPMKETGNSTYGINLALSLERESKKRVIFVRIHSRDSAPSGDNPDIAPRWRQTAVALNDIADNNDKIHKAILHSDLKIDLLNVTFEPGPSFNKKLIAPFVTSLVGDYHYVVVDLPNEMDDVVLETLAQSDLVHLVSLDQKTGLDLTRGVIDRLESALKENFQPENIRIVISSLTADHNRSLDEISRLLDYSVYTRLPYISDRDPNVPFDSEHIHFARCSPDSAYNRVTTRIAREIGGVLLGIALGGGAALGIAHIGILRVLEKENIPVDMVSGSSMGALIGALWACGYSSDEIEKLAKQFQSKRVALSLLDPIVPISGFIGGAAIRKWLKKQFGDRTFYTTRVPLRIVSYDLASRQEIVINSGTIVEAVMQSIAIPGIIKPIRQNQRVIIDGGVLNPLPTNVLVAEGIKKIISVNVLQSPDDVMKSLDIKTRDLRRRQNITFKTAPWKYILFRIGRFFNRYFYPNISDIIVLTLQATEYVIAEQSAHQADVAIHPDLIGIEWYELYKTEELIKRGEEAARRSLPKIQQLVAEII